MTVKDDGRLTAYGSSNYQDNNDLLWGAAAITTFINELSAAPMSRSKVYHLIENGDLPAGRLGARIIGSKRMIREHFKKITAGA
jgi:hypothetical protein